MVFRASADQNMYSQPILLEEWKLFHIRIVINLVNAI